ncbi:hypothetical protein KAR91_25975 [Candidatus Pacearchaeota archaeon]|nr:hypothetical protein [Candidatus Pacearchaeota archaeon]
MSAKSEKRKIQKIKNRLRLVSAEINGLSFLATTKHINQGEVDEMIFKIFHMLDVHEFSLF